MFTDENEAVSPSYLPAILLTFWDVKPKRTNFLPIKHTPEYNGDYMQVTQKLSTKVFDALYLFFFYFLSF